MGNFCREVESHEPRRQRLAVLGAPTMRARRDLAQHFFVSCALTARFGPIVAETAGLAKELKDSRDGRGFSFADLSADMAGVTFASAVIEGTIPLDRLGHSFAVEDFLPQTAGLPEGVSWDGFLEAYGSAHDDRFYREQAAIHQRILALPGYRRRNVEGQPDHSQRLRLRHQPTAMPRAPSKNQMISVVGSGMTAPASR